MSGGHKLDFDKQKFDAFLAIADYMTKRRVERTQYQLKLSIAFWALLAAATFYLHPRPPEWLLVALLIALTIVYIWFTFEIRKRSRLDTEIAFFYIDHAEHALGTLVKSPRTRPNYDEGMANTLKNLILVWRKDFWWSGIHIAITVVLELSSYWLIGSFR